MTTHYAAGFMFSEDLARVALIRKLRPKWQAGSLNGIGGHVEKHETNLEAMIREFREETGLQHEAWKRFAQLRSDFDPSGFAVDFFAAVGPVDLLITTTDEEIEVWECRDVDSQVCVENLAWLIPLALDFMRDGRPLFASVSYPFGDPADEK